MRRPTVLLLALCAVLLAGSIRPGTADSATFIFELSVRGKVFRTFERLPGEKAPKHKVNDKIIASILQGAKFDFATDKVHTDPGGKYFLYYDGKSSWRIATNADGIDTDTLSGQVANKGEFWMVGKYDVPVLGPVADLFANGKVSFVRRTFDPKKIKGTLFFVSPAITSALVLKFKTKGKPTIVP